MRTRRRLIRRLRRGDLLHCEILEEKRSWWFENPYEIFEDCVIRTVRSKRMPFRLIGLKDGLFGDSQTYLAVPK